MTCWPKLRTSASIADSSSADTRDALPRSSSGDETGTSGTTRCASSQHEQVADRLSCGLAAGAVPMPRARGPGQ